jgi:hypothetical protein
MSRGVDGLLHSEVWNGSGKGKELHRLVGFLCVHFLSIVLRPT